MDFSQNKLYITVKDHSVSGEEFNLLLDEKTGVLKTTPQPEPENLSRYYESEDYISHTDGKRSFFEKVYHFVKQKALKDKIEIINKYTHHKGSLIDIGAGTGDFLIKAKKEGWDIDGVEPNDKAVRFASEKGILLKKDITKLKDNSADVITMWHVLEHVSDIEQYIKEIRRILKKDGVIIVAVPNFKSYDAHYYGKYWAAYDVPRHLWHFSREAIKNIFNGKGFNIIKVLPMKFDSFYVSLLSEKYKTGKMNFAKGFLIGLLSNIKAISTNEYSSLIYIIKQSKN